MGFISLLDDDLMLSCLEEGYDCLPVYKLCLSAGMTTEKVAELKISATEVSSNISTCVPTAIENNAVFLVDARKLEDPQDVKCDDLGQWGITSSK